MRLRPCCHLTDRASAAATCPPVDYLTFLRIEAPVSCMRLSGGTAPKSSSATSLGKPQPDQHNRRNDRHEYNKKHCAGSEAKA
jgi:hypothetical protein